MTNRRPWLTSVLLSVRSPNNNNNVNNHAGYSALRSSVPSTPDPSEKPAFVVVTAGDDSMLSDDSFDQEHRASVSSTWTRRTWIALGALLVCAVVLVGLPVEDGAGPRDNAHKTICNPYDLPGYLYVDLGAQSNNRWVPVDGPSSCTTPTDWMKLIRTNDDRVDFLRNRSVILFGDSIDRNNNEHVCKMAGGKRVLIDHTHEFSPPLPVGQEVPPEGYIDIYTGVRQWSTSIGSRPFYCHFERLNFAIINVFYYGYQDMTDWLATSPHYYPPHRSEDRFEQIARPIQANLARYFGMKPYPDLVSVSPTYWSLMRMTAGGLNGMTGARLAPGVEASDPLNLQPREWYEKRTVDLVSVVANAWPDVARKPFVVWRKLHHIREFQHVRMEHVEALNGISFGIISKLLRKSSRRAAVSGQSSASRLSLSRWVSAKQAGRGSTEEQNEDTDLPSLEGLADRFRFDNWGSLILGQEQHFNDELHPKALPGVYLYGNTLIEQLRIDLLTRP